jgi:hypothetical protein
MQLILQYETPFVVTVEASSKSEGVDRQTTWFRPHVTLVLSCIFLFFHPFLTPPPITVSLSSSSFLSFSTASYYYTVPHPLPPF